MASFLCQLAIIFATEFIKNVHLWIEHWKKLQYQTQLVMVHKVLNTAVVAEISNVEKEKETVTKMKIVHQVLFVVQTTVVEKTVYLTMTAV